MRAKLYSIAPSHPGRSARLMLERKGIAHEVVNILPGLQPLVLRAHRFRGSTVPALEIDGSRVQGTLRISRALEQIVPEPPLFPSDSRRRGECEEAERWAERVYQPLPRRIFRWALTDDGELRTHLAASSGMPLPGLSGGISRPMAIYFARMVGADEEQIRDDLESLPRILDRVDSLITSGVLGGEVANAADLQVAPTTGVLLNFPSLRRLFEGRPVAAHAERFGGRFGEEIPIRLPEEWLPETAPGLS